MAGARVFVAFLVMAMVLAGGVTALDTSFGETYENRQVVNETFNPDAEGPTVVLDESKSDYAIYNENDDVTVYNTTNQSNITQVEEPQDYSWNQTDGTLDINQQSDFQNATNASVTYAYRNSTADAIQAQQLTAFLPRLLGFVLPLGLVLAFIAVLT